MKGTFTRYVWNQSLNLKVDKLSLIIQETQMTGTI